MEIIYKCIMSLLASVCFGVIFQVRGIKLLFAGLGGLLGWLFYSLSAIPFPASTIPRFFVATVSITAFSEWCARAFRAPVSLSGNRSYSSCPGKRHLPNYALLYQRGN